MGDTIQRISEHLDFPQSNQELKFVDSPPQRITSDSTLVERFSTEVLPSCTANTDSSQYKDILLNVKLFNDSLQKCPETGSFLLKSASELWSLLDLYYSSENPLPSSTEMFPYLHGLNSVKQRTYFSSDFDVDKDFDLLAKSDEQIAQDHPQLTTLAVPSSGYHLMTVNTIECSSPTLINSVYMDDLLTLRPTSNCVSVSSEFEHALYEPFDAVYALQEESNEELKNRNYQMQIRLMAPLSHFLLYNDEEDHATNGDAAKLISSLMGQNQRPIYCVEFPLANQDVLRPFLNTSLKFPFCDPVNEAECSNSRDRLPILEQTVIWLLNGIKSAFDNLYVGNVLNHHQLLVHPWFYPVEFSVHICCHDKAKFPSRRIMESSLLALRRKPTGQPIFLEFPDSVAHFGNCISEPELFNYLNFLHFIAMVIKEKKNVFVYSYDGFAGSSLLVCSYGLLSNFSCLEDGLIKIFQRLLPKICLAREDYYFLKTVEQYIRWFKSISSRNNALVYDVVLQTSKVEKASEFDTMDWFHEYSEINFPSQIYGNVFLGSVEQASSLTVLEALNIKKIISIDEKPAWFSSLSCTFSHEATDQTTGAVIEPTFTFNNGKAMVYEVLIGSEAVKCQIFNLVKRVPDLVSFVYIYNVRDDGKDSFQELLQQCPEDIQQRILIDPRLQDRVLYHCRVGVSRSATLVIASLMKYFCISFLESYIHVRVLRYNMIIQPNLRLFYELYTYDKHLRSLQVGALQRKQCWWTVCEQIYRLNKPYIK